MEIAAEQRIPRPQTQVWNALMDPAVLRACLPGCESLERTGENDYRVVIMAAVGPVKARFRGRIELADLDRPKACRFAFEGQGGVAGFGKGEARVTLRRDGGETVLAYKAVAQVGGKLAAVGSRLVEATAREVADEFFASFKICLGATAVDAAEPSGPAAPAGRLPGWAWAGIGVVAIAAGYALIALSETHP